MKRAGYRPYQRQRSCEQTHPISGRGTNQACFIYHVIKMLAHYPQLVIVVRNKAEHFGSIPNIMVNEVLLVRGSIPFLCQFFITSGGFVQADMLLGSALG